MLQKYFGKKNLLDRHNSNIILTIFAGLSMIDYICATFHRTVNIIIYLIAAPHLYTVSAMKVVSKGTIVIELAKLKLMTGIIKKVRKTK